MRVIRVIMRVLDHAADAQKLGELEHLSAVCAWCERGVCMCVWCVCVVWCVCAACVCTCVACVCTCAACVFVCVQLGEREHL